MLDLVGLTIARAIASIQLHSHSLVWDKGNYACFATSSIVQAWNFDIIFAFDHIQLCFPHTSLTEPYRYTNFFNGDIVHSWLQHSLVKFFNINVR